MSSATIDDIYDACERLDKAKVKVVHKPHYPYILVVLSEALKIGKSVRRIKNFFKI